MNVKRYLVASMAVFVTAIVLDIVTHRLILASAYEATGSVWRRDAAPYTWIIVLVAFIIAFPFTYMFVKGYEGKGIVEGVRFGVIAGFFISLPMSYGLYAMLPIPLSLALQWFSFGLVQTILLGIAAAAVYRPKND